ncbi:MAG: hypothetical protein J1E38_09930 [Paramuribaculum sp.]|nr:hypothetical protein [Paramuribaculum sp.]
MKWLTLQPMQRLRRIIGLLMMLMGVISVNAIPFVPHHHHDGKICVEQQESDIVTHDSEEGCNDHSEEGAFDVPNDYNTRITGNDIFCFILLSSLSEDGIDSFNLISGYCRPEPDCIFRQEKYTADSQELRGSPFFS